MQQFNQQKKMVVAIDIGTTKVVAMAGYKDHNNKIEIKGVGKVESDGVSRGVVINIDRVVKSISEAVAIAQKHIDEPITDVYVGIAGQHIRSLQHRGVLTRNNTLSEISQSDIDALINDMHKLVLPPGDKILHVIPQEYTVDNETVIGDPIGMSGVRMEANFHIITGQQTASNNITRCVSKAGLNIKNITLEPIASAAAVLSEQEKEAGVVLVDIGGGTTDVTIFYEGIIRHTAVIPLGGHVITKDIKDGCKIMIKDAEKLKVKQGCALAEEVLEDRIILIDGLVGREPKQISKINLAKIIEARVEEILEYLSYEIENAGFDPIDLIGGVVLTGGGALLDQIIKSVEYMTGMNCRLGIPSDRLAHGYNEEMTSPKMSTALGLLILGIESEERFEKFALKEGVVNNDTSDKSDNAHSQRTDEDNPSTDSQSFMQKLFNGAKEFFNEPLESDFK